MSIILRNAHNLEHYKSDLHRNHDHQIGHLGDEVAHNLRFADFGFSPQERLGFASTELKYDHQHLSRADFNREVSAIERRLPNRDLAIKRNCHGDVTHISFDGTSIF